MSDGLLQIVPLGNPPWPTVDPFLFCVHHLDRYPAGTDDLGPDASLAGRQIGQDFEGKDGWRMYHGRTIPGFPQHPHRGFETVTIARQGYIDHSDSLGATARFGRGDVQWMTAGSGIVHAEMFPLLEREADNPAELFQLWLNLPAADKMVPPYFTMLWHEDIPVLDHRDDQGLRTEVTVVAGQLAGLLPPAPPPDSWASRPMTDVAIWVLRMEPGARWTMPAAATGPAAIRTLYAFGGEGLTVDGVAVADHHAAVIQPDRPMEIHNANAPLDALILQGRPIGEPVAQYGPFVLNDRAGIEQAFRDYQQTGFGGWPWPEDDPVHAREQGRFARHANGRVEERSIPVKQ